MEENLGETPAQSLVGAAATLSGILADAYLETVESQGYSVPSEFDNEAKMDSLDDLAMLQADFRKLLATWLERAVPILRKFTAE